MKGAWAVVLLMLLPFVVSAQTNAPEKPQTLRSIRQTYLNQVIVVSGPVVSLGGKKVLLEWMYAKEKKGRYESDLLHHLPEGYHGKSARVVAVQMNELHSNGGGTVSHDDWADPYFDLVVQLDDGKLGLVTTYIGTLPMAAILQSEYTSRMAEMNTNLPMVIGKPLYAVADSQLYLPDTRLEQMTGEGEVLKRLSVTAVPMLEPLTISAAKYIESVGGVVLKLKLPDGQDALIFTSSLYLDNPRKDATSFLSRISGSMLAEIPPKLTPGEVDAIKRHTVFKGMSKDAVFYALGLEDKKNDWGSGGKQLIFFDGTILVYLDNQGSVVDWQSFSK